MKLLYYLPMLLCLAYTARGEEIEKDTAKIRNVELNEVVVQSFKQQRDLRQGRNMEWLINRGS